MPDPIARRLLETARRDEEVRVLELFDAPMAAPAVDLTLAERDTAEVTAALHWADEVHAHGVHPQHVLDTLPFVREQALESTALVLHGPWRPPVRDSVRKSARLPAWPGQVLRDQHADAEACPEATLVEYPLVVDRQDPRMLPRYGGPAPLKLDEDRYLAVVGLCKDLNEAQRRDLRLALPSVSRPGLRVEAVDERDVPRHERGESRRAFQAFIVPPMRAQGWRRTTLEALAQGLPIVALGASIDSPPPGVVFTSERAAVDKAVSCIRSWATAWANGRPAPVDLDGRDPWLDAALPSRPGPGAL